MVLGISGLCAAWAVTTAVMGMKGKLKGTEDKYKEKVVSGLKKGAGMAVERGVSLGVQDLRSADLDNKLFKKK